MKASARVVHELPGRTRIKVVSERGNSDYFDWVAQSLSECPGVQDVNTNVRTGSLLLEHSIALNELAAFAEEQSLFTLENQPATAETLLSRAATGFAQADIQITRLSEGELDVRSILLLTLLILSAVQVARGQILVPASTFLWYAVELLYTEKM